MAICVVIYICLNSLFVIGLFCHNTKSDLFLLLLAFIYIGDIIGCQVRTSCSSIQHFSGFQTEAKTNILYVVKPGEPKKYEWKLGVLNITGSEDDNVLFATRLRSKLDGI